jgi:RimJ/RimL family protein N-acetyltransferase
MVDRVCRLYEALADAPHEEAVEPESWDADRLAQDEQRVVDKGTHRYSIAASHESSGDMAALTQVSIDPDVPECGFQGITAMTRQHRGHRLGLLVKVVMLDWLAEQEPAMRQIVTSNAEVNEHMIAVNEQLGNRISGSFRARELDVAAGRKLASGRC